MPKTSRRALPKHTPSAADSIFPTALNTAAEASPTSEHTGTHAEGPDMCIRQCFPRLIRATFDASYNADPRMDYLGLCFKAPNVNTAPSTHYASEIHVRECSAFARGSGDLEPKFEQCAANGNLSNRFRKSTMRIAGARMGRPPVWSSNWFDVFGVEMTAAEAAEMAAEEGKMKVCHDEFVAHRMQHYAGEPTDTMDDEGNICKVAEVCRKTAFADTVGNPPNTGKGKRQCTHAEKNV